ncbi:hypothetical protein [Burkholderia sp. Ax-1724]|uniref:hypothetical protein n=1 Tax=Burkholderia sp. Ax-1724 TaxID=2608336 RepID=UPI0014233984|nr:hypothetical protein [Burkholderia sp. Ax-1724]NIF53244.1 hypothetical protein [Burkholderia sp. Ax-1724]
MNNPIQPTSRRDAAVSQLQGATPQNASAASTSRPAAPPTPERSGGLLEGLKPRLHVTHKAADVTLGSLFRFSTKGKPVLPSHTVDASKAVKMPPVVAGDESQAAEFAFPDRRSAAPKPVNSMQKALESFHARRGGNPGVMNTAPAHLGASEDLETGRMPVRFFPRAKPDQLEGLTDQIDEALLKLPNSQFHEVRTMQRALVLSALETASGGDLEIAQQVFGRMQAGLSFDTGAAVQPRQPATAPSAAPAPAPTTTLDASMLAVFDDFARSAPRADIADIHLASRDNDGAPSTPATQTHDLDTRNLEARAWRAAQELSMTAGGFESLREIAGQHWPSDGEARFAPRAWLQAAELLARTNGHTPLDADPPSIERSAQRILNSPAPARNDTTAHTQRHLASIALAATKLMRVNDLEQMSTREAGALLAARQGFFADGAGTPLAASKNRLERFLNQTVPRATSTRPEQDGQHGDGAMPVARQRGLNRQWYKSIGRPFGFNKSPLVAMQGGIEGTGLGSWDKDEQALDKATGKMIDELNRALSTGENAASGAPASEPGVKGDGTVSDLVSRTLLQVLAGRPEGSDARKFEAPLDDSVIDEIAERLRTHLDTPGGAPASGFRAGRKAKALAAFRARLATPENGGNADDARKAIRKQLPGGAGIIDAKLLRKWHKSYAKGTGTANSDALDHALDVIDRVALGKAIKPAGDTNEDYRAVGARIIANLEGGGKAIVTEGGIVGLSTRGVSAAAASLPLVAPRLNLQSSRGRQAVLEYSRSTPAYKISFGTQKRARASAGAGLQVGHDFGMARLAGNLEAAHEWDDTEQCTVDLSMARRLRSDKDAYDDDRSKEQLTQINNYLFDNAGRGRSGDELWGHLGKQFLNNDDFSVAWNNQKGAVRHHGESLTFRPGLKIGTGTVSARTNGIVGVSHDRVYKATLDVQDEAGHTQIESHRFGRGNRVTFQAGANFSVSDKVEKTGASGADPTDIASVSVFAPNAVSLEIPIYDGFHQAKATLVREGGRLQARTSLADTEFSSLNDYKKALREDPAWQLTFGVAPGEPMPEGGNLTATMERGRRRIEKYLSDLSANEVQNLRFVARRRLRSHAAIGADALDDQIAMLKTRNREDERGKIDVLTQRRDALLRSDNAWLPTELMAVQANDRQVAVGLRMGLQMTATKGSRGEREVESLKLTPKDTDRLDGVWPRQA